MSKSSRQFSHVNPIQKAIFLDSTRTQSTTSIQQQSSIIQQAKMFYHQNRIMETVSCLTLQSTVGHSLESHYMLAVCYIGLQKYQSALAHLGCLDGAGTAFKHNARLLCAICSKKIGDLDKAIEFLNAGLQLPNQSEVEMLFYRAKVYLKLERYDQALSDFLKAKELLERQAKNKPECSLKELGIEFVQHDQKMIIRMAECYKGLGKQRQCLELLQQILVKERTNVGVNSRALKQACQLKIECLIDFSQFRQAEQLIQSLEEDSQLLRDKPFCSELSYLKGVVYSHLNDQQCVLQWSETLHSPTSTPKAIRKCLEELSIYHMRNRDFYEALQYLMRSKYLLPETKQDRNMQKGARKLVKGQTERNSHLIGKKLKNQSLSNLHKLAEGVTYLMKRKFEDAKTMFLSINLEKLDSLTKHRRFIRNLYYNAMGFTHFSMGNHEIALQHYQNMSISNQKQQKSQTSEESAEYVEWIHYHYNTILCRGIMAAQKDQSQAIEHFQKCTQYLVRPEPYFYISVLLIQRSLQEFATTQVFMKVLNILEAGLRVGENSHMYYYRGLIYVYLGMNAQALEDVDRAIEKSEDNVAKYFYLRGAIFMLDRNYDQALSEFSTCVSIDDKLKDAYLQRGKCQLLIGENVTAAYMDIYEHPNYEKWRRVFSLYQRDFQQLGNTGKDDDNIREMANFYQFKFDQAGAAGKLVIAIKCGNYEQVIPLLEEALEIGLSVGALQVQDILLLKAYCLYKVQEYEQSLQLLEDAEENIKHTQKSYDYGEEDQRKLLMVKLNEVQIYVKGSRYEEAIAHVQILCEQVYQGPIYDQLKELCDFLINLQKHSKQEIVDRPEVVPEPFQEVFELKLFESSVTLSEYFDQENWMGLKSRFWIPMPKIKIHQLYDPNYEKVMSEFGISDVENKPEAPWIRRGQHGIIFTNDIQHFDNLSINTDDAQQNKNKLKQSLQLGSDILAKLNRITKKESQ